MNSTKIFDDKHSVLMSAATNSKGESPLLAACAGKTSKKFMALLRTPGIDVTYGGTDLETPLQSFVQNHSSQCWEFGTRWSDDVVAFRSLLNHPSMEGKTDAKAYEIALDSCIYDAEGHMELGTSAGLNTRFNLARLIELAPQHKHLTTALLIKTSPYIGLFKTILTPPLTDATSDMFGEVLLSSCTLLRHDAIRVLLASQVRISDILITQATAAFAEARLTPFEAWEPWYMNEAELKRFRKTETAAKREKLDVEVQNLLDTYIVC